jgi:Zn-dependent M16 (insulinase) family peptidase
LVLPSQVNYVGKGANLYDAGYRYHGSVNVITNLARSGWLLEKIRVQGGAYGASIGFGRASGMVGFTSYRDPNLLNTLEVYDRTPQYLRTLDLSQSDLTRAIIGAISSFDPYMLPDARGNVAFHRWLVGDTDERMQQIREEILGSTVHRIKEFADVLEAGLQNARISVLGSADAIAKAQSAAQDVSFVTTKVM